MQEPDPSTHNIKTHQSLAVPASNVNNQQIAPQEIVKASSQDDQNGNIIKSIANSNNVTNINNKNTTEPTSFSTSVMNARLTQPTPPPPHPVAPPTPMSHVQASPMPPHPPSLIAIPSNPLPPTHYPAFDFLKMIPAGCHLPNSAGTPKGRIRKKKHLDDHSLLPYTAAGKDTY